MGMRWGSVSLVQILPGSLVSEGRGVTVGTSAQSSGSGPGDHMEGDSSRTQKDRERATRQGLGADRETQSQLWVRDEDLRWKHMSSLWSDSGRSLTPEPGTVASASHAPSGDYPEGACALGVGFLPAGRGPG